MDEKDVKDLIFSIRDQTNRLKVLVKTDIQ